ncbi:MAG: DEAD/DEAH box helicase family protein [Pirellulaceae bacterium]
MAQLADHLKTHLDELSAGSDSPVNSIRSEVRECCRTAADYRPGFYSLNVPTGGGKTLSSLEFALRHADQYKLDRVIVAVPFTSIIEQNVDVYRDVFGSLSNEIVIEHHSNLDPENETTVNRLQAENWDAPDRGYDKRSVVRITLRDQNQPLPQAPSDRQQCHRAGRSADSAS